MSRNLAVAAALGIAFSSSATGQTPEPVQSPARPAAITTTFLEVGNPGGLLGISLDTFVNQLASKKDKRNWVVVSIAGTGDDGTNTALLTSEQARLVATQLWFAADAFDAAPPIQTPVIVAAKASKAAPALRRPPGGATVKTAAQCEASPECAKEGLCTAFGRSCIASSDDDCERAVICSDFHRCSAKAGFCER